MIERVDQWVGKRLFVPVIVRACQAAGITQYRFAAYAELVASVALVAIGPKEMGWIWFIILTICAVIDVLFAALMPDFDRTESRFFRRASVVMLVLHLMTLPTDLLRGTFWVAACFSQYARTIRTIPPRKAKERTCKLAKVRA